MRLLCGPSFSVGLRRVFYGSRRLPGDFHSVVKQALFNVAFERGLEGFRTDFGRFWEAKMEAKIDFCEVFLQCFFRRQCLANFFDVGSIFGGFGKPKWRPKSIFGRFFFNAFFECALASILGRFLEAPNLENTHGA